MTETPETANLQTPVGKYPLLHSAIEHATTWHSGQDRKYLEIPYICHPLAVMEIVRTVSDDEAMLCAAVLHDVVEDTPTTIETIENIFGSDVAMLVGWLTDVSVPDDGNRETRKAIDRQHTAEAPARAQTIKLADLIHNSYSITKYDASFAKVYMHEKSALLNVLSKGDTDLFKKAHDILVGYQELQIQRALKR